MMKIGNWKLLPIILLVLLLSLIPAADADICAGEIVDIVAITKTVYVSGSTMAPPISIDTLEVDVSFKNTGTVECEFRVFLLDGNGNTKDKEPDTYWGNFDIGETGSYRVTAPVSQFADETYSVQLKDQAADMVDWEEGTISSASASDLPEKFLVRSDTCSCYGQTSEASGSSLSTAEYQCGSVCGGLTYCGKGGQDCDSCCSYYCSGAGLDSQSGVMGCLNSCERSCGSNGFFYDLTELFIAITLVIAAVIFAACGLKFIISDEPDSRKQAKRCLIYVVAALILLGIAGAIVGMFYGPSPGVTTTTTTTSTTISALECTDCSSCTDAIKNANSGDTVKLIADIDNHDGTCIEWQNNNITLDCQGSYHIYGDGDGTENGINMDEKTGNTIKNCEIKEFYDGVALLKSSGNTISANTINSNNMYGISLEESSDNEVVSNTVNSNKLGILLEVSSNNKVTGNTANSNPGGGIFLMASSDNNDITGNTVNSSYGWGAIDLVASSGNTIKGNTVTWSEGIGIVLRGSSTNNKIQDNTVCYNRLVDIRVTSDSSATADSDNNICDTTTVNYKDASATQGCSSACTPLPLSIEIISPSDGDSLEQGENITFKSMISGGTAPFSYQWESSEYGNMATDVREFYFDELPVGEYTITVTVTDINSQSASDQIDITVTESECRPLIENGDHNDKIDIVFILAHNATWEAFESEMEEMFNRLVSKAPVSSNPNKFNVYYYTRPGEVVRDSDGRCKGEKPSGYGVRCSFADTTAFVHREGCRDNARYHAIEDLTMPGSEFTADRPKTFVHEVGHAIFGMGDEYYEAGKMYTQRPIFPNVWSSQANCEADRGPAGWSEPCVEICDLNGENCVGYWKLDYECIMDRYESFCSACTRKINWVLGHYQ